MQPPKTLPQCRQIIPPVIPRRPKVKTIPNPVDVWIKNANPPPRQPSQQSIKKFPTPLTSISNSNQSTHTTLYPAIHPIVHPLFRTIFVRGNPHCHLRTWTLFIPSHPPCVTQETLAPGFAFFTRYQLKTGSPLSATLHSTIHRPGGWRTEILRFNPPRGGVISTHFHGICNEHGESSKGA